MDESEIVPNGHVFVSFCLSINKGKGALQATSNLNNDYLLSLHFFYVEIVHRATQTRVVSHPEVGNFRTILEIRR